MGVSIIIQCGEQITYSGSGFRFVRIPFVTVKCEYAAFCSTCHTCYISIFLHVKQLVQGYCTSTTASCSSIRYTFGRQESHRPQGIIGTYGIYFRIFIIRIHFVPLFVKGSKKFAGKTSLIGHTSPETPVKCKYIILFRTEYGILGIIRAYIYQLVHGSSTPTSCTSTTR